MLQRSGVPGTAPSALTPVRIECHLCGGPSLLESTSFRTLGRVASDCRPWPAGGRLAICSRCAAVQKVVDDEWRGEAKRIYGDYRIFHQSGGADQAVFDAATGAPSLRSARVLERFLATWPAPVRGRLLDVGCGAGTLLRAFSALRPDWKMVGAELDDSHSATVRQIPGVESFQVGPAEHAPGEFDLITLSHVLEHVEDPAEFAARLRPKLRPGGRLLVQVPDAGENPFDLVIADHCTHFSEASLHRALEQAGYRVLESRRWVEKELSVVATRADTRLPQVDAEDVDAVWAKVEACVAWLRAIARQASSLATGPQFGVVGTSIAAAWIHGVLSGAVAFFVDEDPNRIGRTYLGRPVVALGDVPRGSGVLLLLPPVIAERVASRAVHANGTWHRPPPFPYDDANGRASSATSTPRTTGRS